MTKCSYTTLLMGCNVPYSFIRPFTLIKESLCSLKYSTNFIQVINILIKLETILKISKAAVANHTHINVTKF